MLREKVSSLVEAGQEWMHSQDDHGELDKCLAPLRKELMALLPQWLHEEHLASAVHAFLLTPDLWDGLGEVLEKNREKLKEALRSKGTPWLLENMDIRNRISDAVNGQNMDEFHKMIDNVVADHLSALQVLGFVLGGLAGIFNLFTR